jgi:DegV family protein with EDD domain
VSGVAVVTDTASDLTPAEAAANKLTVVPLFVYFGEAEYRAVIDMSAEQFWAEMTKPGAPLPRTAAASPAAFNEAFERLFAEGADEIVYVGVGSKLSATLKSAHVAAEMQPNRRILIVDSESATLGTGLLALAAAAMAAAGASGDEIVADIERRRDQSQVYLALDTLEYLRRGGRISAAQAAIGSVLSVKPIITIKHGVVETVDRPRTRSKARARVLELFEGVTAERVAVLDCQAPEVSGFADDLAALLNFPRDQISIHLVGGSIGPHVGPGAYGAVVLPRREG